MLEHQPDGRSRNSWGYLPGRVIAPTSHESEPPRIPGRFIPVIADRFHAIIHDFVMLNALADTNAARGAITLATDTLRTVLSDKP